MGESDGGGKWIMDGPWCTAGARAGLDGDAGKGGGEGNFTARQFQKGHGQPKLGPRFESKPIPPQGRSNIPFTSQPEAKHH